MNPKMMNYGDLADAVNQRYKALCDIDEDEAIKSLMREFKLSRLEINEFLGLSDLWRESNS